jgi:hypothetical protein
VFRKLGVFAASGLAGAALLFNTVAPASAAPPLISCPTNSLTITASVSPPLSNTNTQQSVITVTSGSTAAGACAGVETGIASLAASVKTVNPGTCSGFTSPPPAGTVIATNNSVTSIGWSGPSNTSTGTAKLKSTGSAGQAKAAFKITGGSPASLVGHKAKGTLAVTALTGTGSMCVGGSGTITGFTVKNSTALTVV